MNKQQQNKNKTLKPKYNKNKINSKINHMIKLQSLWGH